MTTVCATYICIAPEGFGIGKNLISILSPVFLIIAALWFYFWYTRHKAHS